jgi:hypothetical protein
MMTLRFVIIVGLCIFITPPAWATDLLAIPAAPHFAEAGITVSPGWIVRFRCNHDGQELICRIDNLKNGKAERFPEILVDSRNDRSERWQKGQWWLHASYNLCEGDGEFNVYNRDRVFQCAKQKPGWKANTFPLKQNEPMEIRISLKKLNLVPGQRFGLAFDVTDTQSHWDFWPTTAILESPATWGHAELTPASQ